MIYGIGTDIVNITRVSSILEKYPNKFPAKIFGDQELILFQNYSLTHKIRYLSKRFAAKEAIVKALGIGINSNFGFKDFEILNDNLGKPSVQVSKNAHTILISKYFFRINYKILISLSDEKEFAIAYCIILYD